MRDFKGMKRQRGRNRSGGGGGGGGGGKPSNNVNRAFDSNGPDNVKIRGHAQHVYEKYQQLARDASGGGDRVLAENYLQHAEHYFRVLRTLQPSKPASEIIGRDGFGAAYDIDFEEEAEGGDEAEAAAEGGETAQGGEGRSEQRQDREPRRDDRGDRPEREFRSDRDRFRDDRGPREDRPPRDDQQRESRRDRFEGRRDDRGPREDRPPREDRAPREDRPPREGRAYGQRDDQPARDPLPVIEPEGAPLAADSPQLRSQDGGVSSLPAFLQAPAAAGGEEGERRPRTRARRRPRSFEAGEGGEPTPAGAEEDA